MEWEWEKPPPPIWAFLGPTPFRPRGVKGKKGKNTSTLAGRPDPAKNMLTSPGSAVKGEKPGRKRKRVEGNTKVIGEAGRERKRENWVQGPTEISADSGKNHNEE